MARDEALMLAVGAGEAPPTLRLYQWDPPTISLGYFQKFAEYEALEPPARNLAVVRRPTGGGAILHDLELTYSISVPIGHELLRGGPRRLYELAHDAVIAALRPLSVELARCGVTDDSGPARGPFFCFERRHCLDVLLDREKLAGSAQRRTRQAVLQHGSIVLGNRYAQQRTAALAVAFDRALSQVLAAFPLEFARVAGLGIEPGGWTEAELARAAEIEGKYAGAEWTRRI
jgi:lipoate-protein ligase A